MLEEQEQAMQCNAMQQKRRLWRPRLGHGQVQYLEMEGDRASSLQRRSDGSLDPPRLEGDKITDETLLL